MTSPDDAARARDGVDIQTQRLKDGTRLVWIDGKPYSDEDPQRARVEGALQDLSNEAAGCGVQLTAMYVVLPLVGMLLVFLVMTMSSCVSGIFG